MNAKREDIFGLRFELQYEYLKTTDLSWLFSTLRSELVRFLIDRNLISRKDLRGKRLAFEVSKAESGDSIIIDIFPLLKNGPSWTLSLSIPISSLLRELYRWWLSRARSRRQQIPPFGTARKNIHRVRTREIRNSYRPDGTQSSETVVEREEETIEWKSGR